MSLPPHQRSVSRINDHRHKTRRLRDILRSNVLHGVYRQIKMPSESELMAMYGVPRNVVRDALALLRHEGLIDRLQGYGTYALQPPQVEDVTDVHGVGHVPRSGFWERVTHTMALAREVVSTPDAVAALMPGTDGRVLQIDYQVHADSEITGVATNYFRFPEAERMLETPLGTDFYDFLGRSGVDIGATELTIGATVVDPNLAETLRVSAATALISMEQRVFTMAGEVFDVAFIWLRADRILLSSFASNPGYLRRMPAGPMAR